jgi:uncharacterized protein YkwD
MRNSFFYILAVMFSAALFLPLSTSAQKNKKVGTKKATVSKTPAPKTATAKTAVAAAPTPHALSAMEKAVFDEINAARKEPKKYIRYLEDYKKLFKGNTLYLPNEPRLETMEGAAAIDDAISFLKTVPPWLEAYRLSDGLNKSAALQLKDLMIDSSIGHRGRDGSTLPSRLQKFGEFGSIYAENISYFGATPRDMVLMWIIDDGLKSRSHRKNIFSSTFKVIGVASGKGKKGESLCVLNLADSFIEKR